MAEAIVAHPRSEIAEEYRWDDASVFPSAAAWEAEYQEIQAALPALAAYQSRLAEGAATLAAALELRDDLVRRTFKVLVYTVISYSVDTHDQAAATLQSRAFGLVGQMSAAAAPLEPEMLALGAERLAQWLDAEPRLAPYRHYVDNLLRKQAHVRSAEVEELLGMLADPFASASTTFTMLTDADFKFPPARTAAGDELPVTQGSLEAILAGPDREARRSAWNGYFDTYLAHKNSLAGNLAASVKQNVFSMRARRHQSTLEAALFESNLPVAVFDNVIAVFRENLPTWHRYWAVRRKALGVDTLYPYDVWAPLTSARPTILYREAIDLILAGLAPMGAEYVETVRRGCLEERWIDVYPTAGKTAGAFSYGSQGTRPFIATSFDDTLFALSTVAHELGHSMHSYLTWQTQPTVYADYSSFVAEVASNFHQALVRAYLLQSNPSREFQLSVIEEALSNFHRYFFIMPTLARFELAVHERIEQGEGIAAGDMSELMADLFAEGYGHQVAFDRQRVGMTWATFGHLYQDYYVFQYATGISAANALAQRVLSGAPDAVTNYLAFLRSGSSLYPLDALQLAGVDMTSPEPVRQAFAVLSGLVDRLEALTG